MYHDLYLDPSDCLHGESPSWGTCYLGSVQRATGGLRARCPVQIDSPRWQGADAGCCVHSVTWRGGAGEVTPRPHLMQDGDAASRPLAGADEKVDWG